MTEKTELTLKDIENLDREYLIPKDIAPILGVDQYSINIQVKHDKKNGINSFPFPTMLIGTRVKIPRQAFLEAMLHAAAPLQEVTP